MRVDSVTSTRPSAPVASSAASNGLPGRDALGRALPLDPQHRPKHQRRQHAGQTPTQRHRHRLGPAERKRADDEHRDWQCHAQSAPGAWIQFDHPSPRLQAVQAARERARPQRPGAPSRQQHETGGRRGRQGRRQAAGGEEAGQRPAKQQAAQHEPGQPQAGQRGGRRPQRTARHRQARHHCARAHRQRRPRPQQRRQCNRRKAREHPQAAARQGTRHLRHPCPNPR